MTNDNATLATDTARPTLADCQHDAVLLRGAIYAVDHLLTETTNSQLQDSAVALLMVCRDLSARLADDLDRVKS